MKLKQQIKKYQLKFGITLFLIIMEAGIAILFPLFIGYAIDDAIDGDVNGAFHLSMLGIAALVVGMGRRIFDSRFYAVVFQDIGLELLSITPENASSIKTARLGMIRELVEFMEFSIPELINNIIGLMGVVVIIATLNVYVFLGCVIVAIPIMIIYAISSKRTTRLNRSYNDEIEQQVDIISCNDTPKLQHHLKEMMKWNIKLSDLEAFNFSFSWMFLMAFLIASILIPIEHGMIQYGALFALIMYAFQFIEHVIRLPLFYQSWLRLKEIVSRLQSVQE